MIETSISSCYSISRVNCTVQDLGSRYIQDWYTLYMGNQTTVCLCCVTGCLMNHVNTSTLYCTVSHKNSYTYYLLIEVKIQEKSVGNSLTHDLVMVKQEAQFSHVLQPYSLTLPLHHKPLNSTACVRLPVADSTLRNFR